MKIAVLWAILLVPATAAWPQTPPPVYRTEVIETTPLPGVDLPLEAIPAPAQTALDVDIRNSGALELGDFLNRRLTGVFVNEIQGNPFQPDVSYRGYTASPLLGTPQGLSVYMDGVRLNQPFGDVVSWDLIPRVAIASTTLMPGSNPLFGLNTLGGALAVQTKDGRGSPGTSMQVTGGVYGRRAVEFEHGGSAGNGLNWYLSGNLFHDSGWRASSPSDVRQIFTKVGWKDARTELHVTGAYADNTLTGNGLQEQRLLAADYASVYTTPDTTGNRSTFLNVTARRSLTAQVALSVNGYFRGIRTNTFNGDVNENSLDQSVYAAGENAANTPFPSARCLAQVAARDEPGEKCNGLLNRTSTTQNNYGLSGQVNVRHAGGSTRNQFTAGGAFDRSSLGFVQSTQIGYLNADRSVTPVNAFADGVTGGTIDGVPYDNRADLDGVMRTASAYATDTVSVNDMWHVTLAGRFNQTAVSNRDRIAPVAGPGSLTGDYTFNRFNPAAGLTVSPSPSLNLYVGYSEGSRAPTSIELGCADPSTPCKLPNALAGDPPLDEVVTHTWEGGIRGGRGAVNWNAGVFRGTNAHDLLFVASTQTGFGYFRNFGETRRQGIELGTSLHAGRVTAGAGYSFVDATYQSDEIVDGSSNSSNGTAAAGRKGLEGSIAIHAGDRIPLIPQHTLKLYADVKATAKLSLNLDVVSASGALARGNENGAHQPDGTYYLGPGDTPAYAVVNAGVRYTVTAHVQFIAQINNVLNTHYYSGAQLGPTGFTGAGNFVARPLPPIGGEFPVVRSTLYAPGAPATFWAGARVNL
jgi:outer membrane receptor protein involved in Fe transport